MLFRSSPNLQDAAFTTAAGRSTFSDAKAKPHQDNYSEPTRDPSKDPDDDGVQPWTFDYDCLSFTVGAMKGNFNNGPELFDLTGNVAFKAGTGCAAFNYGNR